MKFVDIKNDIAFRKIFGNENKKEILISFLNAVLELPKGKKIKIVEIKNPYQLPEIKDLKSSILDVRATDERDISYIVEMQVEEPDGFDKRVQYYTAKQYSSQIEIGEDYPKLNQVIFIGILNFKFFEGTDYLTKHLIINQKTGNQELKDIEFNFIELPKFFKKQNELKTLIEKWTFFIQNAPNLNVIPSNTDDKGLKHAYEDADKHNWTKEELSAYDYSAMRRQDEKGKTELAVKKAVDEAIEITVEKNVIEFYKNDVAIEIIAKSTKLTVKQVTEILNRSNLIIK
jgi:predicted transposase/invertase (TIGR01784 family)